MRGEGRRRREREDEKVSVESREMEGMRGVCVCTNGGKTRENVCVCV